MSSYNIKALQSAISYTVRRVKIAYSTVQEEQIIIGVFDDDASFKNYYWSITSKYL